MTKTNLFAAIVAASFITLPIAAHAQVQSNLKPHVTVAMTFAKAGEAWSGITADRQALAGVIKSGKLSEAHELAYSIRDAAVTLPYKSGGLSPAKRAALQKQVVLVAALAESIDKYGDAGNAAKTKAQYDKLIKVLAAIEALYPANALPTVAGVKPMSAADKALFLTPGGVYTKADIVTNDNTSAYLKYASVVPVHDAKVSVGDPVCPISETKPNPALTWVIGGKTYTFCCPPCIAEFVQKAKTDPEQIKSPETYIKK